MIEELDIKELLDLIQQVRSKKDMLIELYDHRLEDLRGELEMRMKNSNLKNLKTDKATAFFQKTTEVTVADWGNVMSYVQKHNAFDILQRRISVSALEARLNAGEKITGVELKTDTKLVIRSVKEKP